MKIKVEHHPSAKDWNSPFEGQFLGFTTTPNRESRAVVVHPQTGKVVLVPLNFLRMEEEKVSNIFPITILSLCGLLLIAGIYSFIKISL